MKVSDILLVVLPVILVPALLFWAVFRKTTLSKAQLRLVQCSRKAQELMLNDVGMSPLSHYLCQIVALGVYLDNFITFSALRYLFKIDRKNRKQILGVKNVANEDVSGKVIEVFGEFILAYLLAAVLKNPIESFMAIVITSALEFVTALSSIRIKKSSIIQAIKRSVEVFAVPAINRNAAPVSSFVVLFLTVFSPASPLQTSVRSGCDGVPIEVQA